METSSLEEFVVICGLDVKHDLNAALFSSFAYCKSMAKVSTIW